MPNVNETTHKDLLLTKLNQLFEAQSLPPALRKELLDGVALALKEQHRTTRHAAVEKVSEIFEERQKTLHYPPYIESLLNEVTGAVFNLRP